MRRARPSIHVPLLLALLWLPAVATAEEGDEALMHFIGEQVSRPLLSLDLSAEEQVQVLEGIRRAMAGDPPGLDPNVYVPRAQAFERARVARVAEAERAAAAAFVAEQAALPGATRTDSGLIYLETKAGSGDAPTASSTVRVHYHGTLRSGTVFDSSVERNEPATFPLGRVIPCWQEGVALMKPGGKATLVCPSEIAYGDRGSPPGIPGGAALKFEVELLEVVSP